MPKARIAAAAAIIATALVPHPARAQAVACDPPVPNQTCSVSTTHSETDIPVPGTEITAPEPLQGQLSPVLAGPNGTAIRNGLDMLGVLGPRGPSTRQFLFTNTFVTQELSVGPGTILVGPDQTLPVFVPAGTTNININTAFDSFFDVFAGSQPITVKGVNWLSGDLHATVQSALLADGAPFVDSLFSQVRARMSEAAPERMPMSSLPGASRPLPDGRPGFAAAPVSASGAAYVGRGWLAWAAGSGTFARLDGNDDHFGFRSRSASLDAGMERQAGAWLYGGALSIGRSRLIQRSTTDRATIDSRRIAIYAAWQDLPFTFSFVLAYGNHEISGDRLTLLPSLGTHSSYRANSLDGGVEVSGTYSGRIVSVQPSFGLIYDGLWTNSFTEDGGSPLSIDVDAAYADALDGYAGARVFHTFVVNGAAVTPELRARISYDLFNHGRSFRATFANDPTTTHFVVDGLRPDRTSALLGGGITAGLSSRWELFANYETGLRGNSVAHVVSAGLAVKW